MPTADPLEDEDISTLSDGAKSRAILELLKHRHPKPEWATFAELNIGTGGNGGRYLDLYAMNLYPSKGYLKIAYEIKASRADFAKELKDPNKRKAAEELADECYFVAPPGLLLTDEIPDGWGLITLNKGGLRVIKHARQKRVDSLPLAFVMSLARRTADKPPALPAAIWLYEGQEVPEEQLRQFAEKATQEAIQAAELKGWQQHRNSDEYRQAAAIVDTIRELLGFGFANPSRFRDWLQGQLNGVKPLSWTVAHRLKAIREEAASVLKELKDSGHLVD